MTDYLRTVPLGKATVSVINVGDLILRLSAEMNVPESEWHPRYTEVFERPSPFPSQCIHIALPGASVLVDAGDYTISAPPDSAYLPPNYQPPPGLMVQLLEIGVRPEDVTHLVIRASAYTLATYALTSQTPDRKAHSLGQACCEARVSAHRPG